MAALAASLKFYRKQLMNGALKDNLATEAREAGIAFGAVSWDSAAPKILRSSGATHVFKSFAVVRAFLGCT